MSVLSPTSVLLVGGGMDIDWFEQALVGYRAAEQTCPHLLHEWRRLICRNGTTQIWPVCYECNLMAGSAIKHADAIARGINIDALPIWKDLHDGDQCAVIGCERYDVEYHHWAPWSLFDNADNWPGALLCPEHHKQWHQVTRTGSWRSTAA